MGYRVGQMQVDLTEPQIRVVIAALALFEAGADDEASARDQRVAERARYRLLEFLDSDPSGGEL